MIQSFEHKGLVRFFGPCALAAAHRAVAPPAQPGAATHSVDKTTVDAAPPPVKVPAVIPSHAASPSDQDAATQPVAGGAHDVAAGEEGGLASPRYLLWLAVLAGLIALGVARLRRRDKPLPLDAAEPDTDAPVLAAVADPDPAPAAAEVPAKPRVAAPVTAVGAAEAYLEAGEFSQARTRLEAALEHSPRDAVLQEEGPRLSLGGHVMDGQKLKPPALAEGSLLFGFVG